MVLTYDPNVDTMSTPITQEQPEEEAPKVPEKNLDESQMADFSTPIDEIMPGPGRMLQDEVMGPPMGPSAMMQGNKPTPREEQQPSSKKNPLGMTDEQFLAALAGLAGVIAFSKPVQGKLSTMVPKFLGESGELSTTGMAVTALVAAIIFYFARQFIK